MKNLTFSPKGLNKTQIAFLQDIEKRYFNGEEINKSLLYKEAYKYQYKQKAAEKTAKIIEAFDYWTFLPRPIVRESYKKSVNISEFLTVSKEGFFIWGADFKAIPTAKTLELLKDGLIYEITPNNYYFEIIKGCLYIKYQYIIGSRFIAFIKNDLK